MCLMFITADLGQPIRMLNVIFYPTPNSILFWDMIVLNGYLFLNAVVGWNVLEAERNNTKYEGWVKLLVYVSIPWAISIHTVTAFLYNGLPGRSFWLTALLAPPAEGPPENPPAVRFAFDHATRHVLEMRDDGEPSQRPGEDGRR